MMGRVVVSAIFVGLLLLTVGCGAVWETMPGRTAKEQLLISTAADRAVMQLSIERANGKTVFVDVTNLDSNDKPYVVQRIRKAVLRNGGALAGKAADAQVILQVASGALSIDKRHYLVGIPAIPIPIPNAGTLLSPEISLFKIEMYKGKAKLLFSAIDPATNTQFWDLPTCYGRAYMNFWWFLFTGPYKTSDVPE